MKNIKIIFIFLLAAVITNSCKKKYPDTPAAFSPEFVFNGKINSNTVSLQAGANNYYMFTSYVLDPNGVYDFIGELKDKNCTSNCTNDLKISIKDYRQYAIHPTSVDSSLVTGYYNYLSTAGVASKYNVQFFDTLLNGTAQTYSWNFGDGSTSTQHRPLHLYQHPGIYNVTFNSISTNTCISSLSNNVMLGSLGNEFQAIYSSNCTGNTVLFSASVGGVQPYSYYHWDFGDSQTSSTQGTVQHLYGSQNVYQTTLTVTDATGTTEKYNFNAFTNPALVCHCNFYPLSIVPVTNYMNLADVLIEWRDASGTLWTSAGNTQPANSVFKIISVDNYQNNVSGQPTKKIHAKITCKLFNGTSSIVVDGDAVFGVAHL